MPEFLNTSEQPIKSLLYLLYFDDKYEELWELNFKKKIPKSVWKRNQIKCSKNRTAELKTNETNVQ